MTERIVLADPRLPADKLILEGVDVSEKPIFSVSEVAKLFFARSPHWLRWRDNNDFFIWNDEYVGGYRSGESDNSKKGSRLYTLAHVEKMAHSLAEKGAISGTQLRHVLLLVQTEAELYEYL